MNDAHPPITEKDFMAQVAKFARIRGWLCYHVFDSRKSVAGFPDLVMVRGCHLVFAELKRSAKENPTPDQEHWMERLRFVHGSVRVFLWHPGCWKEIEEVLM